MFSCGEPTPSFAAKEAKQFFVSSKEPNTTWDISLTPAFSSWADGQKMTPSGRPVAISIITTDGHDFLNYSITPCIDAQGSAAPKTHLVILAKAKGLFILNPISYHLPFALYFLPSYLHNLTANLVAEVIIVAYIQYGAGIFFKSCF